SAVSTPCSVPPYSTSAALQPLPPIAIAEATPHSAAHNARSRPAAAAGKIPLPLPPEEYREFAAAIGAGASPPATASARSAQQNPPRSVPAGPSPQPAAVAPGRAQHC